MNHQQRRISGDANFLHLAVLEPAIADVLGISQEDAQAELEARAREKCGTCNGAGYVPEQNSLDSGPYTRQWVEQVLCPTCCYGYDHPCRDSNPSADQKQTDAEVQELPL